MVGGDYTKPQERKGTAAYFDDYFGFWSPAKTFPGGFRSAVAYDSTAKTWITVGPNGTDISTDDGRNWRALKPNPRFHDAPDADQHWNALSLPYVVGPHGRIATLRPSAPSISRTASAQIVSKVRECERSPHENLLGARMVRPYGCHRGRRSPVGLDRCMPSGPESLI